MSNYGMGPFSVQRCLLETGPPLDKIPQSECSNSYGEYTSRCIYCAVNSSLYNFVRKFNTQVPDSQFNIEDLCRLPPERTDDRQSVSMKATCLNGLPDKTHAGSF